MPQAGSATDASRPAKWRDRRADRIDELLRDSLDVKNSARANLGIAMADLMQIRAQLAEIIKSEIDRDHVTLEEYRKDFAPAVNNLLMIDRYIVAYGRLSLLASGEFPSRDWISSTLRSRWAIS